MKVWEFCNKIMDMKNVLAESVGMKKGVLRLEKRQGYW